MSPKQKRCRKHYSRMVTTLVSGVRVAVLYTVPEIIQEQKFPGLSKLHNFEFGDRHLWPGGRATLVQESVLW